MSSIVPMSLAESSLEEMWFGMPPEPSAEQKATQSLAAGVAAAKGLKSFPAAASRAIALLNDPDADLVLVESALEMDPALVATLLRMANSALYRPVRPIGSVREAVMRIGMRSVRDLVIGVASMGLFRDSQGVAKAFRSHCVHVGAINRVLVTEWGGEALGDAFLCGLLHDVGKLLTHQVNEFAYEELPPEVLYGPDRMWHCERERLGYDHAILGAHVLDGWRLPETIVSAVALHHNPALAWEASSEVGLNVSLLRIANAVEYELRRSDICSPEFVDELAKGPEAQYAGFDPTILEAMWPKLSDACDDLDSMLAGG